MAHLIIRHKVKDYSTWKFIFDGFIGIRRAGGEKSFQIFHADGEPNNLFALFEWDSLDNARKFMNSSELKSAMSNAGVMEQPEIYFLNEYDRGKV